jgi:hypothetical protein
MLGVSPRNGSGNKHVELERYVPAKCGGAIVRARESIAMGASGLARKSAQEYGTTDAQTAKLLALVGTPTTSTSRT